jgi:hypothetical protein
MADLIALLTIALLFPISLLYVSACDRLKSTRVKGTNS